MNLETLTETLQTPPDVTDVKTEVSDPLQSDSDGSLSRRPRNPFILFRTWYIKQGYLKQVTVSPATVFYRIELTIRTSLLVVN